MVEEQIAVGVFRYGDLIIDTVNHVATVGDLTVADGHRETTLFKYAYKLGREHKKLQIRQSLSL